MILLKKLIFAFFFFISLALLLYQLNPLFKSSDFIFSLSTDTLIELIVISGLISLSSLLFVLFITLSQDWKFTLPVSILASMAPFLFLETGLAIILSVAILVSLLLTFLNLDNSLKSYLNFAPNSLLGPPIRHLAGLLILAICVIYFFSTNKIIAEKGFQIPNSLIDTALNLTPIESDTPQNLANDLIKQTVKDQFQNLLKPYLSFIPAILALFLFLTLQSLTSLINLLIYPLLWIIFYILQKTGFVRFEAEMREVKKMVV